MSHEQGAGADAQRPWYKVAFESAYGEIYAHRDEDEASRGIKLLLALAPDLQPERTRLLDLCCGAGRHSAEAYRRGFQVVGFDLSEDLLREARRGTPEAAFIRGDMRVLPFDDASFGAVVNFFTSFGYFSRDDDHERCACEIARVLRPGGVFLWDHINPAFLRRHLQPRSTKKTPSDCTVEEVRWIDELQHRVYKRLEMYGPGCEEKGYVESVRFFEPEEAQALFARAGLTLETRRGDYDAAAEFRETSPRQIALFRKSS